MKLLLPFIILSINIHTAYAATLEDWRGRTIYQVLTDRFARSDGSSTAACGVVEGLYCRGSWKGIIDKLDYIQGMNFDAIWISPVVTQLAQRTGDGEAYTGYVSQSHFTSHDQSNGARSTRPGDRTQHCGPSYCCMVLATVHRGTC